MTLKSSLDNILPESTCKHERHLQLPMENNGALTLIMTWDYFMVCCFVDFWWTEVTQ